MFFLSQRWRVSGLARELKSAQFRVGIRNNPWARGKYHGFTDCVHGLFKDPNLPIQVGDFAISSEIGFLARYYCDCEYVSKQGHFSDFADNEIR